MSTPTDVRALGETSRFQWWLDRSVRVKGLIVVTIPMIALVAVTVSGLILQQKEINGRQDAIVTSNLALFSNKVLADAIDAETGIRGYAASRDTMFLDPYNDGLKQLAQDLDQVRQSVTTPDQQAQVNEIVQIVDTQLSQLAVLKDMVDKGITGPGLTDQLKVGKDTMNQLRGKTGALSEGATNLTLNTRDTLNNLETSLKVVEYSGLGLGLLAGLAGVALFTSGISNRLQHAAGNADRLGSGEPLAPTPPAADELGGLSTSLTEAEQLLRSRLAQLATARDQALEANEAKNSFLSRTSHELRTPLNAILGFAQLLEMSDLPDDDKESAAHIHRAGRHLLALINELIDISRVESGDLQISVEPVSISDVAKDIVALMRPLAAAREITIEVAPIKPTVAVSADHQRLKQVLVNLVSNAVKYNRQSGRITISCEEIAPNHVDISVSDTGMGLTAAEIERVWTPFERLGAEQNGIEGTGIGLPLALALAEAMNGSLRVESAAGSGSTFTLRLPRAVDIPMPEGPVNVRRVDLGSGIERPITVLSIEDNAANNQVLRQTFRNWPQATLLVVDNAIDGLKLAADISPDLILLDLHLPDMSGEDAFSRLRAEPETVGIPVVVLSADASPATIRRLLGRGVAAYLTKPLDLRELQRVLKTVTQGLNGQSISDELVKVTTVAEIGEDW